jgi:5-methylcytosine-specific restriction endonuclease McrA
MALCACGCGNQILERPRRWTVRYLHGHNSSPKAQSITRNCIVCGIPFTFLARLARYTPKQFCSSVCQFRHKRRRVTRQCLNCQKPFEIRQGTAQQEGWGLYCSNLCRHAYSRGSRHHCWKDGAGRNRGENWPIQRRLALVRDGYRCTDCGMTWNKQYATYKRGLVVHHVVPYRLWASYQEANQLSNLATSCDACHRDREWTDELLAALNALFAIEDEANERFARLTGDV